MTPIFKLVANNQDVTDKINKNSSRITFSDEAGDVSDEIGLVIEGTWKKPKYEDELKLWIGTKEQGLFYCGLFKVQTSKAKKGSQNQIEITATAADFSKNLKVKRSNTYEQTSIKKIAEIIAARNELELSSDFDDMYILHLEQTNESDLHFLKRIALDYNALFSIKNNKLIFKKRIKENQKSDSLPRFSLAVDEFTEIEIENINKTLYNSCKAIYRDTKDNTQKSVTVGNAEPLYVIKDAFENEADAKAKAQAALQIANRGTKVGLITCTGFEIYAGGILNITGTLEDDGEYEIKSVNHTLDENGWNITIDVEN
ncbi:MAG: contractile injection system protein, VgrG/Pvc8 family [Arcobacteraceae bacterium]|jgi:phage protein D|nr:contractile injection system protein, VgrG/Pvc8 family [Arcobacteraceae bacterium]